MHKQSNINVFDWFLSKLKASDWVAEKLTLKQKFCNLTFKEFYFLVKN